MNGRRTAGSCLPAAGALHGPKPTTGWLAVPKPQPATRQRRLFRKYFKFPAKENTALLEESAHDVALLLSAPRRNCKNPGHAILTGTGRPHTHSPTCASPRLPDRHAHRRTEPPAKRGKPGIKTGQREPVQGSTTSNSNPHRNLPSS